MWFTETAWPPIIILLAGAMIELAIWSSSRRALHLAAAGLLTAACVVAYVVDRTIVTERERVEASIFGAAEAFETADLEATLSFFSPRATDLRNDVIRALDDLEIRVQDDLRITDIDIEMLSEDTRARTHFRANGRFSIGRLGDVGHHPTRWNITWQKEGGEWRIIDVQRLDPVRGDPVELLDTSR